MAQSVSLDPTPDIGDTKADLITPIALANMDVMERNMEAFNDMAGRHDVTLRPHSKVHKIPGIAHYQQEFEHVSGILCQTISEAEVMSQCGIRDIFVSIMATDPIKLRRAITIAERVDYLAVTVDGPSNIDPLEEAASKRNSTVRVFLEVDIGLERVGTKPGAETVEMAQYIHEQEHLTLEGILAHDPHLAVAGEVKPSAQTDSELQRRCRDAMDEVQDTVEACSAKGVRIEDVISGCTATARFTGEHPVVTQIDPGRFIFNDVGQLNLRRVSKDDCGLTVLTSVISKPADDRVCVDAGFKTFGFDVGDILPVPKSRDDIEYNKGYSEHGLVHLDESASDVQVGDKLEFIIPDAHATMNTVDTLTGLRSGTVEDYWDVLGRGKTA